MGLLLNLNVLCMILIIFLITFAGWPRQTPPDYINQTRLLISAYYRSGSTFVSSFFGKNPDVFYQFEPARALFKQLSFGVNNWTKDM